jgi:hypothetical protein
VPLRLLPRTTPATHARRHRSTDRATRTRPDRPIPRHLPPSRRRPSTTRVAHSAATSHASLTRHNAQYLSEPNSHHPNRIDLPPLPPPWHVPAVPGLDHQALHPNAAGNTSNHSRASSTSKATGVSCSGGTHPATDSDRDRRVAQRCRRMSTPAAASRSKAMNDAGCSATSRHALAGAITSRRCNKSNDNRPCSSRATSSPSTTHSSGSCVAAAAAMSGNWARSGPCPAATRSAPPHRQTPCHRHRACGCGR